MGVPPPTAGRTVRSSLARRASCPRHHRGRSAAHRGIVAPRSGRPWDRILARRGAGLAHCTAGDGNAACRKASSAQHDGMLVPESCAVPLSSSCCSEARAAPPGVPRAPVRADQDGGRIRTVLTFGVDLASQDRLAASRTSEPCPPPSSASPASGTRAAHPSPGSSPPTRSTPRPSGRHNLIPARDTRPDDYDDGSYDPRHGQPPCASPVGQRVRSRGERRGAGPDGAGPGRGYEGAGPVVRRSTRVTGMTSRSGTRGAPEISPTIRSTARAPVSASGWWIVVSPTKSAASTSS